MEASLFLGTLQRLCFSLGSLFARRPPARPARPRPAERPAAQAAPHSMFAAFEQTRPPSPSLRQEALKPAIVPAAAPVARAVPRTAPVPLGVPAVAAVPVAAVADTLVRVSRPVALAPPALIPVAAAVDEAPVKKIRSLEEVRADLARLRANAKERHAQLQAQAQAEAQAEAQARREIGFTPTDFVDFVPVPVLAPEPKPVPNAEANFAPTAFLDFVPVPALELEPKPSDPAETSFAPTAFFDLASLKAPA